MGRCRSQSHPWNPCRRQAAGKGTLQLFAAATGTVTQSGGIPPMAIALVLIALVISTVLFHIFIPWWFTPIASNWDMIDGAVDLTVWCTGIVFVAVNRIVSYDVIQ